MDNVGKVTQLQPNRSHHATDEQRVYGWAADRDAERRRHEVGLSPLEKIELVPGWKRLLAATGAAAFVLACCWAFGYVLLRVLGA